jgi:hypothetical protein
VLLVVWLGVVALSGCASRPQTQLPELKIELAGIGNQQCKQIAWRLSHAVFPVVVCHVATAQTSGLAGARRNQIADPAELSRQAIAWREKAVDEELGNGIHAMLASLDALPHRSLTSEWRVFIISGVWGCKLKVEIGDGDLRFTDPCNHQQYDASGRSLGQAYPALAISPYRIDGAQIVLGRADTSVATLPPLPAVDFSPQDSSPAEQLVRAARWGNRIRLAELLAAGIQVDSAFQGETALLSAVRARQAETVSWLLARGANANQRNPSGESGIDISKMVEAPEIEALLIEAGAR